MTKPTPPSIVDEITLRFAEEVAKTWRSIDQSPRRAQHKARMQVAFGRVIVDAIAIVNDEEMGTNFYGHNPGGRT